MAAGEVTPEEAATISGVLEARRKALETQELADRVDRLEQEVKSRYWALEMAIREEIEERLKLAEVRQLSSQAIADARAAVEAGEIDRAIQLVLQLAGNDAAGLSQRGPRG
jgi:hypothetical protein